MDQSIFQQAYNNLNPQQRIAVDTIDGPVIVNAGPGSGKTQLLALRVANILRLSDTPASSILCLTFTETGAANMRKRLNKMIGVDGNRVAIHTFHSFGREVISQNPDYFFDSADFQPIEGLGQRQILQSILEDLPSQNPLTSYHPSQGFVFQRDILSWISGLKREGLTPNEFEILMNLNKRFLTLVNPFWNQVFVKGESVGKNHLARIPVLIKDLIQAQINFEKTLEVADSLETVLWQRYNLAKLLLQQLQKVAEEIAFSGKTNALTSWKNTNLKPDENKNMQHVGLLNAAKYEAMVKVYRLYQEKLYVDGFFDFDDMLMQVIQTLDSPTGIALKFTLQEKYLYILVDEFQDTNGVQLRILQSLLYGDNPNVLVVGDTDQAVYKFQGATTGNLIAFSEFYNTAQVINLVHNYRSNQDILDLAHDIISQSTIRSHDHKLVAAR